MRFEFFAWAAARAAQAGSSKTTVAVLRQALIDAGAHTWWQSASTATTPQAYDAWHDGVVGDVLSKMSTVPGMTWGIAAKLVNVFVKGRWLLGGNDADSMVSFGHPALDSIMLKIIDGKYGSRYSAHMRWQRMSRQEYAEVIAFLRGKHLNDALWTLEADWRP
jgi:hypothetical protein